MSDPFDRLTPPFEPGMTNPRKPDVTFALAGHAMDAGHTYEGFPPYSEQWPSCKGMLRGEERPGSTPQPLWPNPPTRVPEGFDINNPDQTRGGWFIGQHGHRAHSATDYPATGSIGGSIVFGREFMTATGDASHRILVEPEPANKPPDERDDYLGGSQASLYCDRVAPGFSYRMYWFTKEAPAGYYNADGCVRYQAPFDENAWARHSYVCTFRSRTRSILLPSSLPGLTVEDRHGIAALLRVWEYLPWLEPAMFIGETRGYTKPLLPKEYRGSPVTEIDLGLV